MHVDFLTKNQRGLFNPMAYYKKKTDKDLIYDSIEIVLKQSFSELSVFISYCDLGPTDILQLCLVSQLTTHQCQSANKIWIHFIQ